MDASDSGELNVLLEQIISPKKLDRDRSISKLSALFAAGNSTGTARSKTDGLSIIEQLPFLAVNDKNEAASIATEKILGSLAAIQVGLPHLDSSRINHLLIQDRALACITHREARVRDSAGQVLGKLCAINGFETFDVVRPTLYRNIQQLLDRRAEQEKEGPENSTPKETHEVFNEVTGWNDLESCMNCLNDMISGCGPSFTTELYRRSDDDPNVEHNERSTIFGILLPCLKDGNRFVREKSFKVLGQLFAIGFSHRHKDTEKKYFESIGYLERGLCDNWSQVRMAASVAVRNLFLQTSSETKSSEDALSPLPDSVYKTLLPPMCINRYYVAEGVKIYSQQTWGMVTSKSCPPPSSSETDQSGQTPPKSGGVAFVERYIGPIVEYYNRECTADNHAVREAACHAIAELAVKIDKAVIEPYSQTLIQSLLECFGDDSWPVRDAACLASSRFVRVFPEIIKLEDYDMARVLWPKFEAQLKDCIPSVRQGAAESIAVLAESFDGSLISLIEPKLLNALSAIGIQKSDPVGSGNVRKGGSLNDGKTSNDTEHSNQTMYSCGSLAPKMKAAGCSSCTAFRREAQPWEITDGAVRLMAQLARMQAWQDLITKMIPEMLNGVRFDQFNNHVKHKETVCTQIPLLAKAIPKQKFKPFLQTILGETLPKCLTQSDCQLTLVAAEECLRALSIIFGPGIIRGRIDMLDDEKNRQLLMDTIDSLGPPTLLGSSPPNKLLISGR